MIETWSRGLADTHMDERFLLELGEIIAHHPWWRARASLTMGLLHRLGIAAPAKVLDAGCGWGTTLKALEAAGYHASGLDVARKGLEHIDREGRRLIEADLTKPFDAPRETFDAVLALDVIEHLDHDAEAVANLATLVDPGGVLIVSVPALPEMTSEFDAIQGHRRRYLPDSLRASFAGSGLDVAEIFWWGQWLAGRLQASRSRSRRQPGDSSADVYRRYLKLPPWPATIAIRAMFAMEERRALRGQLTRGSSLFAVARRPANQSEASREDPTSAHETTRRPAPSRPVSTTVNG